MSDRAVAERLGAFIRQALEAEAGRPRKDRLERQRRRAKRLIEDALKGLLIDRQVERHVKVVVKADARTNSLMVSLFPQTVGGKAAVEALGRVMAPPQPAVRYDA